MSLSWTAEMDVRDNASSSDESTRAFVDVK